MRLLRTHFIKVTRLPHMYLSHSCNKTPGGGCSEGGNGRRRGKGAPEVPADTGVLEVGGRWPKPVHFMGRDLKCAAGEEMRPSTKGDRDFLKHQGPLVLMAHLVGLLTWEQNPQRI